MPSTFFVFLGFRQCLLHDCMTTLPNQLLSSLKPLCFFAMYSWSMMVALASHSFCHILHAGSHSSRMTRRCSAYSMNWWSHALWEEGLQSAAGKGKNCWPNLQLPVEYPGCWWYSEACPAWQQCYCLGSLAVLLSVLVMGSDMDTVGSATAIHLFILLLIDKMQCIMLLLASFSSTQPLPGCYGFLHL